MRIKNLNTKNGPNQKVSCKLITSALSVPTINTDHENVSCLSPPGVFCYFFHILLIIVNFPML